MAAMIILAANAALAANAQVIRVLRLVGARDAYIARALAHCGECHTARGLRGLGALDRGRWLAGASSLDGPGKVPNITSGTSGIGSWSAKEIAEHGTFSGLTRAVPFAEVNDALKGS